MSWADYANYLLAEGCCEEGGIVGTNGAIWAASPTFRLESYKVGIDNEGKEEQVDVDETKGLIEGTAFLLPPETYLQKWAVSLVSARKKPSGGSRNLRSIL